MRQASTPDAGGAAPAADATTLYLRLLRYVRPYRARFALGVGAMLVLGVTEPAIPAILGQIISSFEGAELNVAALNLAVALFMGLFLVRGLSSWVSHVALAAVAARVVEDLRREMFARLLRLPAAAHERASSGVLVSRVTFDTHQVSAATTSVLVVLVRDSVAVVGLLGWMLWIKWEFTLIALAAVPFIIAIVVYFSHRLRRLSHEVQHRMGDVTHRVQESLHGHKVVKVFAGQRHEMNRLARAAGRVRQFTIKHASSEAAGAPIAEMITAIAIGFILILAAREFIAGEFSISELVSFFGAMALIFSPIKRLTRVNGNLQRGIAAAGSVFALLDEPGEEDHGTVRIDRARGRLEFDAVAFRYAGDDRKVLDGVSFVIEPGATVALVGPSGSGKTTIAELIPRFHDPESGHIRLDGVELRDLTLASLRANLAIVGQDTLLFDDTVAANIAYGAGVADAPPDAIAQAARAANALAFIEAMPDGFDTLIGERGVKLSGGQRQRLAIARAVLKDAPLLILDEATSSLDSESEQQVQQALEQLSVGRSTLVIAHRLSTIQGADRIVVIERGRIVDAGTHAELMARSGLYASLYQLQFADADSEGTAGRPARVARA